MSTCNRVDRRTWVLPRCNEGPSSQHHELPVLPHVIIVARYVKQLMLIVSFNLQYRFNELESTISLFLSKHRKQMFN